jgi:hypothetical protein
VLERLESIIHGAVPDFRLAVLRPIHQISAVPVFHHGIGLFAHAILSQ